MRSERSRYQSFSDNGMILYAQNSDLSGCFHEIVRRSNIVPAMRKQGENWEIPSPLELRSSWFAL
jgi:hypothetical protein